MTPERRFPAEARLPGRLVAVEGVDGSGKSTQIDLLHKWLRGRGRKVVFSEWNSSPLVAEATKKGKRRFLLTPTTFSLIHATDFADRYERQILPMLKAGYIVLCDRYAFTSFARDRARGCDPEWLREVYGFALLPDLTLYFHLPVEVALERLMKSRTEPNWFEAGMDLGLSIDPRESFQVFQGRITENYLEMTEEFGLIRMDATRPIHEQQREVRDIVARAIDLDAFPSRIEHVVHEEYGVAPMVYEEDRIDAEGEW
ncbi:MAG TPA: dTMP kinase [Gemmatimonadota bacterium]|nr:dTMP kinase [Gemmatimonadota bacterium]